MNQITGRRFKKKVFCGQCRYCMKLGRWNTEGVSYYRRVICLGKGNVLIVSAGDRSSLIECSYYKPKPFNGIEQSVWEKEYFNQPKREQPVIRERVDVYGPSPLISAFEQWCLMRKKNRFYVFLDWKVH